MRKLIWQMNVSLDGFADHTVAIADDELLEFSASQMENMDILLFGRVTYQLMEGWHHMQGDPNATKGMIEFAKKFVVKPKIVFSRTLQKTERKNEKLVKEDIIEVIKQLKQQPGKNLSIAGLDLPHKLIRQGLIDEYLFLVQPVIVGKGNRLFEGIQDRIELRFLETKTFKSGVVVLRYSPD
jgi:dihydrofolate reductase